jgi:hypothetical protein
VSLPKRLANQHRRGFELHAKPAREAL